MRQILQDLKSGEIILADIPAPSVRSGHLLIRTSRSLISSGTERALLDFGRAGYLAKARQQPEKVKQVLGKVRTDGLAATVDSVRAKLDQPLAMGYCNVGRVVAVGEGINDFAPGDRVASNGPHAELVVVPKNLCAKVPDGVSDDAAAFTVIGSIALQGVRLLRPTLGESFAVVGLGLVGSVAVQTLRAHGAKVIGFDLDPERVEFARRWGIEASSPSVEAGVAFSGGVGLDGVLITASTPSDEVIHQAAELCRKRGRIVLTGVVGLNLRREDFYEKELTFQVSCSYGPGRYDPSYEDEGLDYPIGYVRWTEQRNFEAVLDLLADGQVRTEDLVSSRFALADAAAGYDMLASKSVVAVLLEYPEAPADVEERRVVVHLPPREGTGQVVCGLIGSGSFAQQKLLPGLKKTGARLAWVVSAGGVSAAVAARRFGVERSTSEIDAVLGDPDVNAVVIATRHDVHADLTICALKAGKSVYVEKPLCLNEEELERIVEAHNEAQAGGAGRPILMVGFNRRFAPLVVEMQKRLMGRREPLAIVYTVNAGAVPADHWVHDQKVGGGRIIGEACHFIDLLQHLVQSPIASVSTGVADVPTRDTASITLTFEDGSLGVVNYFANGSRKCPKELIELFCAGRTMRLENFRRVASYGFGPDAGSRFGGQDKGHDQALARFVDAVGTGAESPTKFPGLLSATRASIQASD